MYTGCNYKKGFRERVDIAGFEDRGGGPQTKKGKCPPEAEKS